MKLNITCKLSYVASSPSVIFLNVEAQRSDRQFVESERLTTTAGATVEHHEVPETGNRLCRVRLPAGELAVTYTAVVVTNPLLRDPREAWQVDVSQLPFETLQHLYPSRYCQSDLLARFAWREFGTAGNGHSKVTAICNWIHTQVDYLSGSSNGSTSAYDTFSLRAGVCRDFAHLGITLTRALGIPARFVSAYAAGLEPQDFHAVFEAYLEGGWYVFDATRLCALDSLVKVGVGRDAADTAFSTFYGAMSSGPVVVEVAADAQTPAFPWTTQAVRLS